MRNPVTRFTERQEQILRHLMTLRGSLRRGEVTPEWVLVSVCTVLETACSELLDELLKRQASQSTSALERALIQAQKTEMNKSWVSRLRWLSLGFSTKLDENLGERLSAMIELRNAVAHDGGTFTRRQVEQYSTFLRNRQVLESAFGVSFSGTRFRVSIVTGDRALDVGREVVIQLLK